MRNCEVHYIEMRNRWVSLVSKNHKKLTVSLSE